MQPTMNQLKCACYALCLDEGHKKITNISREMILEKAKELISSDGEDFDDKMVIDHIGAFASASAYTAKLLGGENELN